MNNQTQLCRYTYDPLDRLAASAQSGQPISQCFYQAGQLQGEVQGLANRMLMRHGDQLLAQRDQRERVIDQQLLGSDRQHSVLSAIGRQSQQAMAYSPYGHRPAGSALTQLPGFAGERLDPVTGHYMLGNGYRSFNPVLMRFNSPDSLSPFGEGGFNAYAYCLGDPVNYRDPDGHIPDWLMIAMPFIVAVATAGVAMPLAAALGFSAAAASFSIGTATGGSISMIGGAVAVSASTGEEVTNIAKWVTFIGGVLSGVGIGVGLGGLAGRSLTRHIADRVLRAAARPSSGVVGRPPVGSPNSTALDYAVTRPVASGGQGLQRTASAASHSSTPAPEAFEMSALGAPPPTYEEAMRHPVGLNLTIRSSSV